jgi:hypothetical protein
MQEHCPKTLPQKRHPKNTIQKRNIVFGKEFLKALLSTNITIAKQRFADIGQHFQQVPEDNRR